MLPCDHMIPLEAPICYVGRHIPSGCAGCSAYVADFEQSPLRIDVWADILAVLAATPALMPPRVAARGFDE